VTRANPASQDSEQLFAFRRFEPHSFGDAVKMKTEKRFQCRILCFQLFQLLLRNRVVTVILVIRRKDIVYASHYGRRHMPELFLGHRYDEAHEVVDIDLDHGQKGLAFMR
jgi:hypothetical protein